MGCSRHVVFHKTQKLPEASPREKRFPKSLLGGIGRCNAPTTHRPRSERWERRVSHRALSKWTIFRKAAASHQSRRECVSAAPVNMKVSSSNAVLAARLVEGIENDALAIMVVSALMVMATLVWAASSLGRVVQRQQRLQHGSAPARHGAAGGINREGDVGGGQHHQVSALDALCCFLTGQPETPDCPSQGGPSLDENTRPTCPICLDPVVYAIETACGHAFCGLCWCQYWQRSNMCRKKLCCPMDRRTVYGVFPSLVLRERDPPALLDPEGEAERERVDHALALYNRMFNTNLLSDNLRWAGRAYRQWEEIPLGLRTYMTLLLALIPIYVLSPLDLVPEFSFGGAGLIDDAIVLGGLVLQVGRTFRSHITVGNVGHMH